MLASLPSHSVYQGTCRKLVLAFDVGTTYSGVSYSILDPGQIPEIAGVTRFPGQERTSSSKIPTIIYYDEKGQTVALGAEATRSGIELEAEDKHWTKAEWFKFHLRPSSMQSFSDHIPPLPPNKSIEAVLADFYSYLLKCSCQYIEESHVNGPLLWNSLEEDIDFVLSHPNGWQGQEQGLMRRAAIYAGLVPDTSKGHSRISFVSEGEASLHFAIQSKTLTSAFNNGNGVVVVDAGGGTVDISSYRQDTSKEGKMFEEIAPPRCLLQGSVFVNFAAKIFLTKFLDNSDFKSDVDHIVRIFDKTTKLSFRDETEPQFIKFGSTRDVDEEHSIRIGQLKLEGSEVAGFFFFPFTNIIQAILDIRSTVRNKIMHVLFVGGFAANDWLFKEVSGLLNRAHGTLNVTRPVEHINKAVSIGAISFYLDHLVRARVARFTYGSLCSTFYNPINPEHKMREASRYICISGHARITDKFSVILAKNTKVSEETEFRGRFYQVGESPERFRSFKSSVYSYCGRDACVPGWKDLEPENFFKLCTVLVDLSRLPPTPKKGKFGNQYYQVDYEVVLLFGLTELKAQLAWKDNGVEKRSTAEIIYDP